MRHCWTLNSLYTQLITYIKSIAERLVNMESHLGILITLDNPAIHDKIVLEHFPHNYTHTHLDILESVGPMTESASSQIRAASPPCLNTGKASIRGWPMLGPAPAPCDVDGFGAIMVLLGNFIGKYFG